MIKRMNISLSSELAKQVRKYSHINWSKVCQEAIKEKLLEEEARIAQVLLLAGLQTCCRDDRSM